MPSLSVDQLKRALKISEQIQNLEAELASILGTSSGAARVKRAYNKKTTAAAPGKKKRKKTVISPEGKERIAAAQRLRWAKLRKAKKA